MEKKRRQRINRCLNDLKSLVLEGKNKDVSIQGDTLTPPLPHSIPVQGGALVPSLRPCCIHRCYNCDCLYSV